jgi:putative peptide zinc metalloprotease protein
MDISKIVLSENKTAYIAIIEGKAYKINYSFYTIIKLLQVNYNLNDAYEKVSDLTGFKKETLKNSFTSFLNLAEQHSPKKNYIRFRKTLISAKNTKKISRKIKILYNKGVFFPVLIVSIVINIFFFFSNRGRIDISSLYSNLWLIGGLVISYLISLLFHELGHATACAFFRKDPHEIGFGVYFIFPVLYTNVTCVWTLKPADRIVVNFGGIYFQLIFNACLILTEIITNNFLVRTCLLNLILANIAVIITSFIPFFRNDGYWMLSDILGVDNLLSRSDNCIFNITSICEKEKFHENQNTWKLLMFGILNWIFRIYILYLLCKNVYFHFLKLFDNDSVLGNLKNIGIISISIIGILWMLFQYLKFFRKKSANALRNF